MTAAKVPEMADGTDVVEEPKKVDRCPPAARKIAGMIFAAVVIFLAQRDLRNRPTELVRGRVGVWKFIAMIPPGAIAYLVFGRRKASSDSILEVLEPLEV